MATPTRKQPREIVHQQIIRLEEQLRGVNQKAQKFTLRKSLNKLQMQIEADKDLELTSKGFYDVPYHCDLYGIA